MTTSKQDVAICDVINDNLSVEVHGDATSIIEWVADNMEPDEVFSDYKLQQWALNNGYRKED